MRGADSDPAVGLALLAVALAACSAGRPPDAALPTAAGALANGHGSAAEVLFALDAAGLPCVDEARQPPTSEAEELFTCRIGADQVVVAHFLDVAQAEAFRASVERDDQHSAYTSTWAVRTSSPDLA